MTDEEWVVVDEVAGPVQAEIMRGMLVAKEIPAMILPQEGIGHVYGMTIGEIGRVQILVPLSHADEAEALIEEYYQGTLENEGLPDQPGDEDEESEN